MSDATPPDDEELLVADDAPADGELLTVEELLAQLEGVIAQRDEYLGVAQRTQAEFENFRKRMMKQQADELARASSKLVESLLPVLDAFDYGVAHGDDSLVPMRTQLLGALEREAWPASTPPARRSTPTSTKPWRTSPATAASPSWPRPSAPATAGRATSCGPSWCA